MATANGQTSSFGWRQAAILAASLFVCACATTRQAEVAPKAKPESRPKGDTYFVVEAQKGETIARIGDRYQVNADDIIALNRGTDDRKKLAEGTEVRVPSYGHLRKGDPWAKRPTRKDVVQTTKVETRPLPPVTKTVVVETRPLPPARQRPRLGANAASDLPSPPAKHAVATGRGAPQKLRSNAASDVPAPPAKHAVTAQGKPQAPRKGPPPNEPKLVAQDKAKPQTQNSKTKPQPQEKPKLAEDKESAGASQKKFLWPVNGRVLSSFGQGKGGERNDGINILVPKGTPVRAADIGTVTYVGNELKGYGNLILIKHDKGYVSAYAHADTINVARGDKVTRGQVIARAGETGDVSQPQVHFELRLNTRPVNPALYLVDQPGSRPAQPAPRKNLVASIE